MTEVQVEQYEAEVKKGTFSVGSTGIRHNTIEIKLVRRYRIKDVDGLTLVNDIKTKRQLQAIMKKNGYTAPKNVSRETQGQLV